jgi:hypothetical protein
VVVGGGPSVTQLDTLKLLVSRDMLLELEVHQRSLFFDSNTCSCTGIAEQFSNLKGVAGVEVYFTLSYCCEQTASDTNIL